MTGTPCLIPARGGSKRLPRKNVVPLLGKPLLAHVIDTARASGLFERVWVSTEDAEIAAVAARHGGVVHDRPPELSTDTATVVQVCLNFAEWRRGRGEGVEAVCVIQPTAALLRPEDLVGGARLFEEQQPDVVMAITRYLEAPFAALHEVDGYLRPYFGAEANKKSQELPRVCVDSGSFYFARVEALRRERTFYTARLLGYQIPRDRSLDIDEPEHLRMAEALLAYHARAGRPEATS